MARELSSLDSLKKFNGNGMKAVVSISGRNPDLKALKGIVERATGSLPLYLNVRTRGAETLIQTSFGIEPDRHLVERIEDVFGKGTIRVV